MPNVQALSTTVVGAVDAVPLPQSLREPLIRCLGWVNNCWSPKPFEAEVDGLRMMFDLSQLIDSKIYYTGAFEPETVACVRQLLPRGGVVVDVGAQVGYLSLIMAQAVGPAGRVIAFEPSQWAVDRLNKNCWMNPNLRVQSVHAAVSNEDVEQVDIVVPNGYRLDGKVTAETQPVAMVTLDRFFEQHPTSRLDLIKIDTDGWESHIIEGAMHTLREHRPALLFELGPGNLRKVGRSAEELIGTLSGLGYQFFGIDDNRPLNTIASDLHGGETVNVLARCDAAAHSAAPAAHKDARVA